MTTIRNENPTRAAAVERLAEELFHANGNSLGARWDNEADDTRAPYRSEASRILRDLGAVFVDAGVVEACRRASSSLEAGVALIALADHVMGQVEAPEK